jgi:hypothetical protein
MDDDHKALDGDISNALNGVAKPFWPAVLAYITLVDNRLVILTPDAAKDLLESNPTIEEMLQKAWDKEIRKVGAFLCSNFLVHSLNAM